MARASLVMAAILVWIGAAGAAEPDPVDLLMQRHAAQAAQTRRAHSDFTDPLGRFMDSLAAGAFTEAKALQPAACMTWRTDRSTTALSGRFHVWDTVIDLDTLCGKS